MISSGLVEGDHGTTEVLRPAGRTSTSPGTIVADFQDCPFCASNLQASTAPHDQILWQNGLICVLPPLGSLTLGHLLVIARSHVVSMAQLGNPALRELDATLSNLRSTLRGKFGEYLMFEHGTSPLSPSGPCIAHAHIHLFPLADKMCGQLISAMPWLSLPSYEVLGQYHHSEYAYLQVGMDHFVYPNPQIESQWIRRKVAQALNRDDWDYCLTQGEKELDGTIRMFRSVYS